MANLFSRGVAKIFGNKSEKDIKAVMPYVEKINQIFSTFSGLSNDELRQKTYDVRATIDAILKTIDDQIAALHEQVENEPDLDIHAKEDIFARIDKLEEDRNVELEKVLLDVLPDAFAIVKETARRFYENETLDASRK